MISVVLTGAEDVRSSLALFLCFFADRQIHRKIKKPYQENQRNKLTDQTQNAQITCTQTQTTKLTLCGVEDTEKVENGVVDISRTQEGQAPGGTHQAGKTKQC